MSFLPQIIFQYSVFVLNVVTFLYGVTSWCILKKFRNFKNYVYINTIVASLSHMIVAPIVEDFIGQSDVYDDYKYKLFNYFMSVQYCWLLVICYIFYIDIVKVFKGDINRRYLKSGLFAWGVPLVTTAVISFLVPFIFTCMQKDPEKWKDWIIFMLTYYVHIYRGSVIIPLFINLILYIKLVYKLFRHVAPNLSTNSSNKWRCFYIATLIFVFSDVIVVFAFAWDFVDYVRWSTMHVIANLQVTALCLYLPIVRNNRELWKKYFADSRKRNSERKVELEMNTTIQTSASVRKDHK